MNVDLTHRRFEIFQKKLRFVLFRLFLRVKIFYLVFAPPTLENEPREKIFDDLKTRTCDILKTQNLKENIPTLIVSSLAISRENGFNNARQLLEKYTRRSKSQPAGCHPHVTPREAPLLARKNGFERPPPKFIAKPAWILEGNLRFAAARTGFGESLRRH